MGGVGVGSGATFTAAPPFVAFDPALVCADGLVGLVLLGLVQLGKQGGDRVGEPVEAAGHLVRVRLVGSVGRRGAQRVGGGGEAVLRGAGRAVLRGKPFSLAAPPAQGG